jgi:lipopolysaccharide export system protein LptA
VYASVLTLLVCLVSLTLGAEDTETEELPSSTDTVEIQTTENTVEKNGTAENTNTTVEPTKEIITGTSKRMESYEQEGLTILIDEAKTVRRTEQGIEIGFLNADKITLKRDIESGVTTEIVAEGNVEIRDQDIFATCDHAIMDNLTSTIILTDNVVVLQNKDRLETKFFTFNRVTGKQTAEGDVKFKVTVTQAPPVDSEADENTENGTDTGEEQTSPTAPQETEGQPEEDTDTDNESGLKTPPTDAEDKSEADAGDSEDADPEEETDTDTGNPDEADPNTETEESESN